LARDWDERYGELKALLHATAIAKCQEVGARIHVCELDKGSATAASSKLVKASKNWIKLV
jgi:hypothetical protein